MCAVVGFLAYSNGNSNGQPGSNVAGAASQTPREPALPYRLSVTGKMLNPQTVGVPVSYNMQLKNTGRSMRNLVVWAQGLGSWVIDNNVSSCTSQAQTVDVLGDGNAWAYGPLHHGASCSISLELDPKTAGNPTLNFSFFGGMDSGSYDLNTEIKNDNYEWSGTINPF